MTPKIAVENWTSCSCRCQHCRLQKCLQAGMIREAVQEGEEKNSHTAAGKIIVVTTNMIMNMIAIISKDKIIVIIMGMTMVMITINIMITTSLAAGAMIKQENHEAGMMTMDKMDDRGQDLEEFGYKDYLEIVLQGLEQVRYQMEAREDLQGLKCVT